jgi:2'-5' RNA ligase
MIRLFVALSLPETVRRQTAMLQGGLPGARWSSDEQLHLTLRFIGEVDEGVARDIDDALSGIESPAFTLTLSGVGEFGGKNPRMLWAGVRPSEPLRHLQRKVETALQRLGLEAEGRKFSPHVTLARLRGAPLSKVREFLSAHALFGSLEFPVESFALYSSQLTSDGSIYRIENEYALR